MALLRLEGVWFRYTRGRWALRGASLEAGPGEAVALVGPNGAGKTTLLKVAGLLLRPERGRVEVLGRRPWEGDGDPWLLRREVVYVHERPVMFRGTVLDNIAYGLRARGVPREEAEGRAREVAEALGLEGLLDARAQGLSAGQAQLVALARALAVRPRVLLLDEPFAHLDLEKRRLAARAVRIAVSEGAAVVVASHDTGVLSRLASKVYQVREGVVEEAGPEALEACP